MRLDTVTLEESHDHQLTTESFGQLLDKDLKPKWDSFSGKTKENIWDYFQYLRGLVEIHDTDNYDSWAYWNVVMTEFVRGFDESHPYYDGNFEKVVLRTRN